MPTYTKGDPDAAEEARLVGDVLTLRVRDDYENLPHKVLAFFSVAQAARVDFAFKSDDQTFINVDKLMSELYLARASGNDYLCVTHRAVNFNAPRATKCINGEYDCLTAGKISNQWPKPGPHEVILPSNTLGGKWHQGKCAEPAYNAWIYTRALRSPYCVGNFGYALGSRALAALRSYYLNEFNDAVRAVEIYEDKLVGDVMYDAGVKLSDFELPGCSPDPTVDEWERNECITVTDGERNKKVSGAYSAAAAKFTAHKSSAGILNRAKSLFRPLFNRVSPFSEGRLRLRRPKFATTASLKPPPPPSNEKTTAL